MDSIKDKKISFGKYKSKTYSELLSGKPEYNKYIEWLIKQRKDSDKNKFLMESKEIAIMISEYEKKPKQSHQRDEDKIIELIEKAIIKLFDNYTCFTNDNIDLSVNPLTELNSNKLTAEQFISELKKNINDK
jgi:hypothetical protein